MSNTKAGYNQTQQWTQRLIEHALALDGTYYLPYQLFSTKEQFEKAYPQHAAFKKIRTKYDPNGRFSNMFLKKYVA